MAKEINITEIGVIEEPLSSSVGDVRKSAVKEEPFRGYTMEELKYQRALIALKKDFCREKLISQFDRMRHPGGEKKKSSTHPKLALAGRIASIVFSNLNTFDYMLMGMSAIGTLRKGINLFRKK